MNWPSSLCCLSCFFFHNCPAFETICGFLTVCFFKPVNSLFSHLSLLILCLCGLVSPPLLPFINLHLCPLVCFSCATFLSPALSPTLFISLPPTFYLSLLILLFLPSIPASSMSLSSSSSTAPPLLFPLFHLTFLPALSGISLWR